MDTGVIRTVNPHSVTGVVKPSSPSRCSAA
ncbi:hypothetical protein [Synechococcus sp. W4D4]